MLDPNRLTRIAVTVLAGLALACLFIALNDSESTSQLKRGDFPGFYGPAVAIHRGLGASLYDLDVQRELQNEAWPSFKGHFYIYAYPPFVAVLLRPLALLSPLAAKTVATLFLLALMIAAVLVAKPFVPILSQHRLFTLMLCLMFPPMLSGVLAAQNTAISLFLFVVALRLLMQRDARADLWAGVALGLWLFKPQYPMLMLMLLGLSGRWRVLLGASIPALLYFGLGASVAGWDWPLTWPQIASEFSSWNTVGNRAQIVSIHGLVVSIGAFCFNAAAGWSQAGALISVIGFMLFAWYFVGALRQSDAAKQETALLLAAPVIVIVAPQTLFYDIGIGILALARMIEVLNYRTLKRVLMFFGLAVLVAFLRSAVAFPVYSLFSAGIVLLLIWAARHGIGETSRGSH